MTATGSWRQRLVAMAAAAAAVVTLAACRQETREPITFQGRSVVVENPTAAEWQNVEVWLNGVYRVTKSRMPPGERFSIPLNAFVAGFGQRFDAARQPVRGVEVRAVTAGGTPVRHVWGTVWRR